MIDGERLWRRLSDLGEIGRHREGGVTRLSFTDEERAAKDRVASYMDEAGLSVREDAAGNLFGRREGRNADLPSVLVGSHVDSVYNGGDFDGPLGVLAGVEVLQTMQERGVETDHPIEVVAFTDEEGARFGTDMLGSAVATGRLDLEAAYALTDRAGLKLKDELEKIGFLGTADVNLDPPHAYVECHVEQG
ncbi:MAG TPA: hydantoinase/carbamoylase family amidase, partial [Rubrobacteraceae bacterium]|nr:hydantoinase/carbamoylase family amidase [Rubrobacteraceae bacterium]